MGKNNNKETPTNETEKKAFWIVGIALIVFLIILFGSLIGLKITRDGINKIANTDLGNGTLTQNAVQNYEELENGVRYNTSEDVVNAEIVKNGIRLAHFNIGEFDGISTFSASVENLTQEVIEDITINVQFYDSNNVLLDDFSIPVLSLEPEKMEMITSDSMETSWINAAKVEADIIVAGNVSGE